MNNGGEIRTDRLILRPFRESDYDDLFEFLFQLKDDEFEGYPGVTSENGRAYLEERIGSAEYAAMELIHSGKVIGNICCGIRRTVPERSAISSTGAIGGRAMPGKPFPR